MEISSELAKAAITAVIRMQTKRLPHNTVVITAQLFALAIAFLNALTMTSKKSMVATAIGTTNETTILITAVSVWFVALALLWGGGVRETIGEHLYRGTFGKTMRNLFVKGLGIFESDRTTIQQAPKIIYIGLGVMLATFYCYLEYAEVMKFGGRQFFLLVISVMVMVYLLIWQEDIVYVFTLGNRQGGIIDSRDAISLILLQEFPYIWFIPSVSKRVSDDQNKVRSRTILRVAEFDSANRFPLVYTRAYFLNPTVDFDFWIRDVHIQQEEYGLLFSIQYTARRFPDNLTMTDVAMNELYALIFGDRAKLRDRLIAHALKWLSDNTAHKEFWFSFSECSKKVEISIHAKKNLQSLLDELTNLGQRLRTLQSETTAGLETVAREAICPNELDAEAISIFQSAFGVSVQLKSLNDFMKEIEDHRQQINQVIAEMPERALASEERCEGGKIAKELQQAKGPYVMLGGDVKDLMALRQLTVGDEPGSARGEVGRGNGVEKTDGQKDQ